jgi:hypothetical protein
MMFATWKITTIPTMKLKFWGELSRSTGLWKKGQQKMISTTHWLIPLSTLPQRVTPNGSAWWSTTDPVHLAQESYQVLASVITGLHVAEEDAPSTVGSSGSTATDHGRDTPSSGKRKRVDSVVISMPARVTRGRVARRPAWLSGGTENYNPGWRGGHGHRGWNPNWRGASRTRSRSRYGRRGRLGRW